MKLIKNSLLVATLLMGLFQPTNLKASSEVRLFPSCTGIAGAVHGERINFRNHPSEYGEILRVVDDTELKILGKNDEWYKVDINGAQGWIYKDFIEKNSEDFIPYTKVLGEEIVDYGRQFIGTPYIWGGSDLKTGVDCSGLTQKVYQGFDINISRVSYMQIDDGKPVNKDQLQPGDLVFFDTSGTNNGQISHVGIFVKDDKFLHADSTNGVMISSLNSNYYTRSYVGGCRILNY